MIPFQVIQLNINEERNSHKAQVIKTQQPAKKKHRSIIRTFISIPPFPFLFHAHPKLYRAIKLCVKTSQYACSYSFRELLIP